MADTSGLITGLDAIGTIDRTADLLEIVDVSANTSFKVTVNNLVGISGAVVGTSDTQPLSNKTIGNTNIVTVLDSTFTIQDNGDNTKQAQFQLSANTTGTTRVYSLPDATGTLMDLASTQTASNKTFTSPTINGGTLSNVSISANTLTGFTTSNTGSIYGITVTAGVIQSTNSVNGTALTNSSVTASKLATGVQVATVATAETSASTSYTDLATTTDTVTVTIGANGFAFILLAASQSNSAAGNNSYTSFAASGSNTIAAADARAVIAGSVGGLPTQQFSWGTTLTGLAAGSTTFKMKYKVSAGTTTFSNRTITVIPL